MLQMEAVEVVELHLMVDPQITITTLLITEILATTTTKLNLINQLSSSSAFHSLVRMQFRTLLLILFFLYKHSHFFIKYRWATSLMEAEEIWFTWTIDGH